MTERHLLVVDDEADICELVRNVAEPLGFEVRVCTDPMDFERHHDDFAPTDIVLDVVMPERDGIDILGWLAKRESAARITVMTGYNPRYAEFAANFANGVGIGGVRSLVKPVSIKTLRTHLTASP